MIIHIIRNSMMRKMMASVIVFLMPFCSHGQEYDKIIGKESIERTTALGIGCTNRLDTYLSPEEYQGTTIRFLSDVMHSHHSLWDTQLSHEGDFDITHNRANNANAISAHYNFAFSMMHRWNLMDGRLILRVGAMSDLYLGFAYNTKNTANNPAQGYASIAIGGAGKATYQLKLFNHTYPISYELRLPLAGVMFSPAYGQSYYEIFYGSNYDSNIVFTTISTPSLYHRLSIDIPTGKTTSLHLGYQGNIRQSTPNNLKQHEYSHCFVVGVKKKL